MEKRVFIYIDHIGNVLKRKTTDSSIIQSLPRAGDEVYDRVNNTSNSNVISGLVQRVQFDYLSSTVTIYVRIDV